MKVFTLFIICCFLLLNSACQNQTVLSQQSENSHKSNSSQNSNQSTETTSDEDVGLYIEKLVADKDFLNFNDYKIKKIITKKQEDDSPEADIEDAILEKKGKRILKFEGVYYPLGNQMQFGLFSLTQSKNKELLVYDNSNRFGRFWIVNFDSGAKQIFDSEDWDGFREWVNFVDFENDGIYEFTMARYDDSGFEFLASIETPMMSIIFKYDKKAGKYLPANYKYQDTAKKIIEEQDREEVKNNLTFRIMMENFLELIYSGMEKESWEYFEKNYDFSGQFGKGSSNNNSNANWSKNEKLTEKSKQEIRMQIEKSLKENKIYQFVKSEVSKNN